MVNEIVDPTFRFMTLDWDGKIRMDPSSEYAMQPLIALKDRFDLAVACDTDHDRHGIVTRSVGLLPPNHYLAVCADYLFSHRPHWTKEMAVGKTVVSSSMIDRVAAVSYTHLIAQMLNFLILVWLLKRFLYQPILTAIDTREKGIASKLADAEAKVSDAQKQQADFEAKNKTFDEQRDAMMAKACLLYTSRCV